MLVTPAESAVPDERSERGGRERILDPLSRISEILFGLIMALTFTGTLSAVTADREEIRTLLFGAIGCNVAWGLGGLPLGVCVHVPRRDSVPRLQQRARGDSRVESRGHRDAVAAGYLLGRHGGYHPWLLA
jgi:hypothetical protein